MSVLIEARPYFLTLDVIKKRIPEPTVSRGQIRAGLYRLRKKEFVRNHHHFKEGYLWAVRGRMTG